MTHPDALLVDVAATSSADMTADYKRGLWLPVGERVSLSRCVRKLDALLPPSFGHEFS